MEVGGRATQEPKPSLCAINEHFEPFFNAAAPTHDCRDAEGRATQEAKAEIVFQQPAR
jgi:hypothetical protein